MDKDDTVVTKPPADFTETEIQDLVALVRAGGEVAETVLEENVKSAKCLVAARRASRLVGVAALKNPKTSYRKSVEGNSGAALSAHEFPFELGYVFVLPSARRGGLGREMCRAALTSADRSGVFATARTDNDGMKRILQDLGFVTSGRPYGSERGDYQLQLFLRRRSD